MPNNAILFPALEAQAEMTFSLIFEAEPPTVLDGTLFIDHSSIFVAREARIEFPLHRLVRSYSEYSRLFAVNGKFFL